MPPLPKSSTTNLEPPATKFITVFDKIKVNPTKNLLVELEATLKGVQAQICKNYGLGQDVQLSKVIQNITVFFTTVISPVEFPRFKEVIRALVNFLINVVDFEDIKRTLRDENDMMKFLTSLLLNEKNNDDCRQMMILIEHLSRDMVITWKIPYMVNLINYAVNSFLNNPDDITINLQFLINVCRKNHCCVLILRSCENYKAAWKSLRDVMQQSQSLRIDILVSHFNYLTEVCIPFKNFLSGYEMASLAMTSALSDENNMSAKVRCELIEAIRQMIENICEKMRFVLTDSPSCRDQTEEAETIVESKNRLLELITKFQEDLRKFVNANSKIMQDEVKECVLAASLTFLLPYNTASTDSTLVKSCKAAAEVACVILSTLAAAEIKLQYDAVRIMLRISELIDLSSNKPDVDFLNRFKVVVKSGSLITEAPMVGLKLEWNIALVRLYGTLLFDPEIKVVVKKQLSGKAVQDLFNNTVRESPGWKHVHQKSVFAIELMSLLARFSEAPEMLTILLNQLSNPEIVNHISSCIRNGDEKEIAKALHLISSVAFNRQSIWATAKSLKHAQEQVPASSETSSDIVSPVQIAPTDVEVMDYVIDDQKPDPSSSTASDILSWCQIRREVHQHEINMLNNHIMQLNRTIANLNALLEKQSNFVAKHIAGTEQRDLEVSTLQRRYENAVKDADSKIKLLEQESNLLKEQGSGLVQVKEAMQAQIKKMEAEIDALQNDKKTVEENRDKLVEMLRKAKEEKKVLREELRKVKSEFDGATNKIAELERKLSRAELDKEQLQLTLEKKSKIVDAVSSIVGKNFNFGSDG